ncbi:S-layer homology domain-containing protein [Paenibacillus sp. BK720]|uniref:S-layer homology domain-containing protein n=1 Tax=Paenibacillus sp. BK720 TaxID=2587092 RepID=UPI001420F5DD|nr:S-layer homology domain-containing protein [Paenibacillus sp. BK720]NIK66981.1 putative repeat protein (TIGR01451 family) [Paenibacillus sp. BK720]
MFNRRWLVLLLVVVILTSSATLYGGGRKVYAAFSGEGDGTTGNPYIISSIEQLKEISDDLDAAYRLGTDLDLSGENWEPIGSWSPNEPFTGVFDGDGHTISNLTIDTGGAGTNDLGLFGYASNADIRNVGLVNVNIDSYTGDYIGGLIGYNEGSLIEYVYVTGTIKGDEMLGGLTGYSSGMPGDAIRYAYSSAKVTGSADVGGLNGKMEGYLSVEKSYYNSTLTSTSAGGQALTEADMKRRASFTDWYFTSGAGDDSEWGIFEGLTYPMLRTTFDRITLDTLKVTAGSDRDNGDPVVLEPSFASDQLFYSGNVPNGVDQVTVYVDAQGSVSSINNGTALETIDLDEGDNLIPIKVTSAGAAVPTSCVEPCSLPDAYELTYTLQINRAIRPQQADLQMQVAVNDATPTVGDLIVFTANLTNAGPDDATNVKVNAMLPEGVTFVSAAPSQGSYDPSIGDWRVGTVSPGSYTLQITGRVDALPRTFTATVSAEQDDLNMDNNAASITLLPEQADLGLILTGPAAPNVGDTITYSAALSNAGPDDASNVSVSAMLPAGVTFVSAAPSQGTYIPDTGVWSIGAVQAGQSTSLTITAVISSPDPSTYTMTVLHSDQPDPASANNSTSRTITPQQADLEVELIVDESTPTLGSMVTYTTTLTNKGPNAATHAAVSGLLPAGVTLVSAVPSQGTYDPSTGVWTVGTVAAEATLTITAAVTSLDSSSFSMNVIQSDQHDPDLSSNYVLCTINPVPVPAITDITAAPSSFASTGGITTVSLAGINLTGKTVEVYLDGKMAATAIVDSPTSATATVTIPRNTTTSAQTHTLTVYLNGAAAPDQSAPITVNGLSSGSSTTPVHTIPVIDQNGITLDPATIDTSKPFVTLDVTPKGGMAYVSIPASVLSSIAGINSTFFIDIKTPYGSYQVPVNLASLVPGLKDLLAQNNLHAEDISFKITLTDKSGDKDIQAAFAGGLPNGTAIGSIVDFSIEIINGKTGQSIGTADQFNQALTRIIPMPKNMKVIPEQWGAFRFNEATKKFEFVAAKKVLIDNVWYVMINSYSNSVYVVAQNPVSFTDVQQHWSQQEVELAATKGLVNGMGGRKYNPNKPVSRAEFTAMLVRALGRSTAIAGSASYEDVQEGSWYFNDVAKAKKLGLLDFVTGKSFKPDQPLTREEMTSMLAAVIALEKLPTTLEFASLDGYKDAGSINAAYLEDVRTIVKLHIMSGTSEHTFSPKAETTRAQAAVVLIRLLKELGSIDK